MWNGRYDIVKNIEKCGENILSNQIDLRDLRFVCTPLHLRFCNSWVQSLKSINIILNVTFAHITVCYKISVLAIMESLSLGMLC